MTNYDVDFVVLGAGVAGLSASLFAALKGYRVLVCEKTSQVGGTTASSAGIAWVPSSAIAKEAGISDSPDKVRIYLREELGKYYRENMIDAYLESAAFVFNLLQSQTEVKFTMTNWPDYHSDVPGASSLGRTLIAQRFDGRRLKDKFHLVRAPYKSLMLFGGMSLDKDRVEDFLNPFRSFGALTRVTKSLVRFAYDRIKYGRGTDIGGGNALVASLLYSLLERGGEVWVDTQPIELVKRGRGVGSVLLAKSGETVAVNASKGIILATGGFPANAAMRQRLAGDYPHDITFGLSANVGDGLNLAQSVGGTLDRDVVSPAFWQPSSKLLEENGSSTGVMYGYLDRGRPGVIAIDSKGQRFVNESNSYHDIGMAMFRSGLAQGNRFYFICDRKFVWHHGLGMIRPYKLSLRRYIKSGYIVSANSLETLAEKIDVSVAGLIDTVAKNNSYAASGVDSDFGRGETEYNKLFAHPRAKGSNKNLAPICHPPYIALRMYPGSLGTAVGISVNENAQVLSDDGTPIPGLFACGNDMTSIVRGTYPGGGITIGPAIVFAYRAIENAIARIEQARVSL